MQYPIDYLIDVPLNDNSSLTSLQHHSTCSSLKNNTQMACTSPSKDMCPNSSLDHQDPSKLFHNDAFGHYYICLKKFSVPHHFDSTSTYYHECQIIGLWLENIQYGTSQ